MSASASGPLLHPPCHHSRPSCPPLLPPTESPCTTTQSQLLFAIPSRPFLPFPSLPPSPSLPRSHTLPRRRSALPLPLPLPHRHPLSRRARSFPGSARLAPDLRRRLPTAARETDSPPSTAIVIIPSLPTAGPGIRDWR
ncbi:hypothetical protein DFH09DRAFT_1318067 [Mycena vulgaris]|nr:hypothetical protein DFH09DRAFT_1318067 [Mycena vulgaris]